MIKEVKNAEPVEEISPEIISALQKANVYVGPEVKPFLTREINDELFKDLLYDKVDI